MFEVESGLPIPPLVDDLTGRRFGRYLVIERAENHIFPNGKTGVRWLCRCECGREKTVFASALLSGRSNSCGCLSGELAAERTRAKVPDVVGQRFGRWVVLSQIGGWCRVRCDCGRQNAVELSNLQHGTSQSCGCLNAELSAERGRAKVPDVVGQRFGRLVVLSQNGGRCRVRCDCGKEKAAVRCHKLISREIDSCGCLELERHVERQRAKVMQHRNLMKGDNDV